MLNLTDTYSGQSGVTATQIDAAFAANGKVISGLGGLITTWAPRFGFRAEAVAGQISLETGWGTNFWTSSCRNILSIGVTGESTTDATKILLPDWQPQGTPQGTVYLRGYRFPTIEAGLLAGLIHMATYIYGPLRINWPLLVQQYCGDTQSDPRLPALLSTALPGTVKTFSDLGNGRFAAAAGYGAGIVSRANTIGGTVTAIQGYLNVPSATREFYAWLKQQGIQVVEHYVADGWVGRGGLQPEAIVHHVTDGDGVMGSINWWENASVDGSTQQIVAGPNDPDFPDGTLVITRHDEDTAWANGAWGNPNVQLPTVARWQAQNINPNRVTLSREHSGRPFAATFPSEKQLKTSLYANLQWMAKFPQILPDRAHLLRHSDIDSINRINCPGVRFPLDSLTAQIVAALSPPVVAENVTPRLRTVLDAWEALRQDKLSVLDAWAILRNT